MLFFRCCMVLGAQTPDAKPVRLAIAGLVHGHVSGFLKAAKLRKDVEIVGVFDPDAGLTASYAKANGFAPEILFQNLGTMLDRVHPEAVATFTSTGDHAMVVEACAARKIAVMMEKPLAVDNGAGARHTEGRGCERHRGDGELRDHLVQEPRRDLEADPRAERRRRDPQDGGDGRARRARRRSTSSRNSFRLADGPGEEWRRARCSISAVTART